MEDKLRELLTYAKDFLEGRGISVEGLHYFLTSPYQRFSRRKRGIAVCFDAITHNPHFFGKTYENWRRIKLVDLAFQVAAEKVAILLPDHELYADIKMGLREPFNLGSPAFEGLKLAETAVDVTADNSVRFVEVSRLLESGVLEPDCTLHRYCERYGVPHILQHGRHYISPDSSSVEALEAICDTQKVESVLEIGGGVGTCGVAAERRGIKDYTFVDLSPEVCNYLRSRFPSYKVTQANAFEFPFDRRWDLVLMGVPYELNPWFLAKKGSELSACAEMVVFQSGCTAFFQFEHEWIFGKYGFTQWPWWRFSQTLRRYYQYIYEMALDWQTCIIAGRAARSLLSVPEMHRRGFAPVRYNHISAST